MTQTPSSSDDLGATPAPKAGDVYEASLEGPDHENFVARAGRAVAELASMAFGDDNTTFSGVAVVVRRKDDGAEVLRIDGGNYESDQTLLDMVRADLQRLSPQEFIDTWGPADDDYYERAEERDRDAEREGHGESPRENG